VRLAIYRATQTNSTGSERPKMNKNKPKIFLKKERLVASKLVFITFG